MSYLHNNVIDWDVNQLYKEPYEAHYAEANCSGNRNLLKLYIATENL